LGKKASLKDLAREKKGLKRLAISVKNLAIGEVNWLLF